jgi:DNA-directed RNA polymerase
VEKMLLSMGWNQDELYPGWSSELRMRVGLFILEVATKQGYVSSVKRQVTKTKTQGFIDLSPQFEAQFRIYQAELEKYAVKTWPLIRTPKEWIQTEGASRYNYTGGYYHEWIRKQYRLCRSYNSDTEFGREAIDLLNKLNATAWCIDSDVYQIARSCLEKGFSIGSLNAVSRDPALFTAMPEEIAALPVWDTKKVAWKKERSLLHHALAEAQKKSIRSRNALVLADRFLKQPRFYLSWSCDYRGRMYSQQSQLHLQSSDLERSLINFADGCKLDERGKYWAAQAVGSAFLGSKTSYQERNAWTHNNKELIEAIADDPISTSSQWEVADDPWQFLQLCLEWNKVVLKEEKHLWDVPIGADASASGLQLLSAMRRDPKGMEYANLFAASSPSEPPKDAYMEVLRVARELAKKDKEAAWMTPYLRNRKLGKTILMKVLYGATDSRNRTDVKMVLIDDGLFPDKVDYKGVIQLTKLLRVASQSVFPKAFEALDWLRDLYNLAKKNGSKSLRWTTPNDDSIHLIENKTLFIDVRTSHLGQVRLGTEQGDVPDFYAMRNAIAPSFVHSYDACVLKSSFKDWTHPLSVIHDCIKVLPNDMDRALDRVKKGFVHVVDPLARLADDLGVTKKQLKRLPQGTASLEDVLDSTYMLN